ncbi:MAG TPA: uroporphyrinogen-III synthase [Candidatus Angelobacter sp.]|nr:uroporphyrinogen-III synthase [Candidatus Angelobacter sp.]
MSKAPIPFRVKGKPLVGRRVLVTRPSHQAFALAEPLRQLGAHVIEVPTIEIHHAGSLAPLDNALIKIDHYDTLILTSVNGVEVLFERYNRLGLPIEDMKHLLVVAIGPATAAAIESEGLGVSIVPEKYVAESVIEALRGKLLKESRVLLVRAKVARDVLPDELKRAGAKVDVIEAYETRVPEGAAEALKKIFTSAETRPDIVTFTSSSTATNFLQLLADQAREALGGVCVASIGPVTSATLEKAGFKPMVEAREYTMQGLVEAIADFASGNDGRQGTCR